MVIRMAETYVTPGKKKILKYEHFDSLLIYDYASDLMSTPPITLTKDATMSEAKALMRDHRAVTLSRNILLIVSVKTSLSLLKIIS